MTCFTLVMVSGVQYLGPCFHELTCSEMSELRYNQVIGQQPGSVIESNFLMVWHATLWLLEQGIGCAASTLPVCAVCTHYQSFARLQRFYSTPSCICPMTKQLRFAM